MDKVDQWHLQRWGKLTGSELFKIVVPKPANSKSTSMFSPGGVTYIEQKVVERLTVMQERPEMEGIKSLLWGRAHEEPAFNEYRNTTRNFGVKYCGTYEPIFLDYNEFSGASPDGIDCNDDGTIVNMGLEIKCPKNSSIHLDYLRLKDQYELKNYSLNYYTQIQFLLMITKAPIWHWASFDARFKDRSKRLKIIEVLPDKKFQDDLDIRLLMAEKEVNKILSQLQ